MTVYNENLREYNQLLNQATRSKTEEKRLQYLTEWLDLIDDCRYQFDQLDRWEIKNVCT